MTKQVNKNRNFQQALKHAVSGIGQAVRQEKNMKCHVLAAGLVVGCGIVLSCTVAEWLWLVQCIVLVFMAEMINTIVETLVDVMANQMYFEWAKKAKDMAAGVVLLSAIYACIVAGCIFIPKLFF